MTTLAQSLIKTNQNFSDLVEPSLVYISNSSGQIRIYTFLQLADDNTVVSSFKQSLESLIADMESSKEYTDIQIMAYSDFAVKEAESMKEHYKVGTPKQVSKARFWEMLEMLPPQNWVRLNGAEGFRFAECLTGDLYSYFLRIGENYFEMVNHSGSDYSTMLQACEALDLVDMPDIEDVA